MIVYVRPTKLNVYRKEEVNGRKRRLKIDNVYTVVR